MLLPVKHFDWLLLPSSCVPHKRTPPRQVCCDGRVRYAGRRASRWAGAYGEIEGHLCQFQLALHPCTTPRWVWAAPPPCSLAWLARPWIRSDRRGVLWCEVENLPAADGILEKWRKWKTCQNQLGIYVQGERASMIKCLTSFHREQAYDLNHWKTRTNQSALVLARGVQFCSWRASILQSLTKLPQQACLEFLVLKTMISMFNWD